MRSHPGQLLKPYAAPRGDSSFIFIHKTTDIDVSSNILFKKWWTGVKIKCKNLSLFIFGDRDVQYI